jgi:hypothetical protein
MGSPAPAGVTSVVANVVTAETVIVGAISLPSVQVPSLGAGRATYHFQLLELLNNPRLGSRQTVRESIALTDVYVLPKSGPKIQIARELLVRPESIICAYEYEGERRPAAPDPHAGPAQRPERVVIITTNGLQIEGTFLGGLSTLAAPKQKRFVALLDATLGHTDQLEIRLAVPFIAVNYDEIVAFTQGEAEAR